MISANLEMVPLLLIKGAVKSAFEETGKKTKQKIINKGTFVYGAGKFKVKSDNATDCKLILFLIKPNMLISTLIFPA